MKRGIFSFLMAGLFLVTGFSCSEEVTPKPYTYTKIFTGEKSKTWDLARIQAREKNKENLITYSIPSCSNDDRYIFYANEERLFEVKNGRSACDPDDSGVDEGDLILSYKWEYSSATATLNMVLPHIFGYYILPMTVTEIDDEHMVLELPLSDDSSTAYIFYFNVIDEDK